MTAFSSLSHSLLPRGNQWTALSSMCPFGMLCITISPDGVEPSVYNSKRVTKRTHCSLSVISHKCFVTMTESWQIQISRNSGSYQRGRHKTNKLYLECHTRTRGPGKMGCSCSGEARGSPAEKRQEEREGFGDWKGHTAAKLSRSSQTWTAILFWFQWALGKVLSSVHPSCGSKNGQLFPMWVA